MKLIPQLFLFTIEGRRFGLNLNSVLRIERAAEITEIPEAPELISGIIDYHGTILPVFDLRKKLGLPDKAISVSMHFIIINTSARSLVLIADSVEGVITIPEPSLIRAEQIEKDFVQKSFVILDDGIIFIYDVDKFLSSQESKELDIALSKFEGISGGT